MVSDFDFIAKKYNMSIILVQRNVYEYNLLMQRSVF